MVAVDTFQGPCAAHAPMMGSAGWASELSSSCCSPWRPLFPGLERCPSPTACRHPMQAQAHTPTPLCLSVAHILRHHPSSSRVVLHWSTSRAGFLNYQGVPHRWVWAGLPCAVQTANCHPRWSFTLAVWWQRPCSTHGKRVPVSACMIKGDHTIWVTKSSPSQEALANAIQSPCALLYVELALAMHTVRLNLGY